MAALASPDSGQPGSLEVGAASPPCQVRRLVARDVPASARLHREVLGSEFVARGGERFLRLYHLAWCESRAGLALAAVASDGQVVGVLLGTLEPAAHYRYMARRHGLGLALCLLAHAVAHPSFGRELVATRALRYARGALRVLAKRPRAAKRAPVAGKEGEIAHLMVAPAARGAGVGRALVHEALRVAKDAGLDQVVLVTSPDLSSSSFYLHLGWQPYGEVTSRSGERFARFKWSFCA